MQPSHSPADGHVVADAPFEDAALRSTLGCFPTGVTVVTTAAADGRWIGVTANSFTSVSMRPPLVLWNLACKSPSLPAFEQCQRFAINILAADQAGICRQFAAPAADKFAGVDTLTGLDGVPLIDGAVAHLECRTAAIYPGGDHLILMGQIVRYRSRKAAPLMFCKGILSPLNQDALAAL
ncbi:flavin reductase family protein [Cupriavidus basilensis]|jgi:flavin reductase (DIM6/NTAB) family NADH-FMN oxidoreductase RutF|uniref:flavin reductase family protein n=1 Tax=Cupriavidus TaxID=106589 RepID=UPI0023E8AF33|nr:flavin reductase family protein [Cupriavidus basilensis]MDF3889097.1 flavin reductase family protein [Cupriavidus basilensis]